MLIQDARERLARLNHALREAESDLMMSRLNSFHDSSTDLWKDDTVELQAKRDDIVERRDYFLSLHPEAAQPEEIEPARDDPKRLDRVLALLDQAFRDKLPPTA